MNKSLMYLLCAIAFLLPFHCNAEAYKAFCDTHLYNKVDKEGSMKRGIEISKGDTIYKTAETVAFILDNKDSGINNVPVEYKGKKGFIYLDDFYQIKTEASDRLSYPYTSKPENRSPLVRFMAPQMEWAMNLGVGPAGWLYGILICMGCAVGFVFMMRYEKLHSLGLLLGAVSLAAVSVCEIIYSLSYEQHLVWFIMPSYVGGWGHTILNFLLMTIVIGLQIFGIYYIWAESLQPDGAEEAPKWIKDFSFLPVILGIALMIMLWVDKGTISATTYLLTIGSLAIPAGCGMAWMFSQKRYVDGIVYPLLLMIAGIGLTCALVVLSFLIVLVAIVIAILAVAVVFGLGALSALFGGEEVKVITNDGRTVRGTKNWDGTVSGYDGKKYHVK